MQEKRKEGIRKQEGRKVGMSVISRKERQEKRRK